MKMKRVSCVAAVVAAAFGWFAYACSSSSDSNGASTTDAGTDASKRDVADNGGDDAGETDLGQPPPPLTLRCTQQDFDDNDYRIDGGLPDGAAPLGDGGIVVIQGALGPNPVQYRPNCIKVSLNQHSVVQARMASHPLEFQSDRDGGTPTLTTAGGAVESNGGVPGTFAFQCANHPDQEYGAVQVVP